MNRIVIPSTMILFFQGAGVSTESQIDKRIATVKEYFRGGCITTRTIVRSTLQETFGAGIDERADVDIPAGDDA